MLTLLATITILAAPSPELCRDFGVDVPDGSEATGRIVEYHIADQRTVNARCQRPFGSVRGCAIPVNEDEYVIYVIDSPVARLHEECHSLHQTKEHVKEQQ